jgi:acetyl esterase/lipase
MTMLEVAARRLPPPVHASEAARAMLASPPALMPPSYPADDDIVAWRAHIAEVNSMLIAAMRPMTDGLPVETRRDTIAGVPVFHARPRDASDDGPVFLDMHGGALAYLGGEGCGMMVGFMALRVGLPVVSVDYRMPPDHPYPAGLDDCVAVYRALLADRDPSEIVIGGSSAGGNLAAATILKARDAGLPLPAAAVLLSPEIDLTEGGDSIAANLGIDPVLVTSLMRLNRLYADGAALDHPYVSPLFGDFTAGFPRSFVQAGTRDLFLSNAVNMHRALRRAGVDAELHIFEGMPHGGFFGAPEDIELAGEIRTFLKKCLRAPHLGFAAASSAG